jgi:hypothetical protein
MCIGANDIAAGCLEARHLPEFDRIEPLPRVSRRRRVLCKSSFLGVRTVPTKQSRELRLEIATTPLPKNKRPRLDARDAVCRTGDRPSP